MTYYLSSEKMTILVETDGGLRVTATAPIACRFVGQPLANLIAWMARQGGFRSERIGCVARAA